MLERFVRAIDAQKAPRSFLILGAWIFLRVFFEGLLEASHRIGYVPFSYKAVIIYFVHYPSFYLSLFLILVIVTALVIREKIQRVGSAFSTCFGIVLFVPVFDWLIGYAYSITYPLRIEPYLLSTFNPLVSMTEYGASPGQRIVFALICILTGIYAYFKTKKIMPAILLFVITYLIIIILGGLPTIIAGNRPENFYVTGGILYSDSQKYAAIFLLLSLGASILYGFLANPDSFRTMLASLRPERALFYGGVGIAGFILSLDKTNMVMRHLFPYLFDRIGIFILGLCLSLGFQGAAGINDFYDTGGDRVTRPRNPLLKNINPHYYLAWTIMLIAYALAFALLLNYVSFLTMLSLIFISLIYSIPPVRLKRIPVISTFILAIAVMLSLAMGYSIRQGADAFKYLPGKLLIPITVSITLGFSMKDLQDIEGDRQCGILSLPIIFAKLFGSAIIPMAAIIALSFLVYPLFIPTTLTGAIIAAFTTAAYTVLVKNPREWLYFIVLYLFGAYLVFSIF